MLCKFDYWHDCPATSFESCGPIVDIIDGRLRSEFDIVGAANGIVGYLKAGHVIAPGHEILQAQREYLELLLVIIVLETPERGMYITLLVKFAVSAIAH